MSAGSAVRVGITLPSFQSDPERVLAVARAAEDAGLDGVFAFDHLFRARGDAADGERRPALELLTMTAAVAAATRRIMVGTLVARATLRPPAMLRAAFDTVDRIAPGRLIAGLGAGDDDSLPEDAAFGVLPGDPGAGPAGAGPAPASLGSSPDGREARAPSGPDRELLGEYRLARLADAVDALAGRKYPVWMAGATPAAIRLTAGRADGWNLWGGPPARFAAAAGQVRAELAAQGRGPAPVGAGSAGFALTWGGLAVLGRTPAEARAKSDRLGGERPGVVRGTPSEVADQIAAYAAAGAAWVILGPVDSTDPSNASILGDSRQILLRREGVSPARSSAGPQHDR